MDNKLIIKGWLELDKKRLSSDKYSLQNSCIIGIDVEKYGETQHIHLATLLETTVDGYIVRVWNSLTGTDNWLSDISKTKYNIYYKIRVRKKRTGNIDEHYYVYISKNNPFKVESKKGKALQINPNGIYYAVIDQEGKLVKWRDNLLSMVLYSPDVLLEQIFESKS